METAREQMHLFPGLWIFHSGISGTRCIGEHALFIPVRGHSICALLCYRDTDEPSPPHPLPRAPFGQVRLGFLILGGKTV